MSDEHKDNKIEAKSADSSSGGYAPPVEYIPAKEAPEQELYHAKSFWTKWVFCQDAKVIGPNGFFLRMRRSSVFNML